MTLRSAEFTFNGLTVPYASYDSTKTTLGNWIYQVSGSAAPYSVPNPSSSTPSAVSCNPGLLNYAGPFQVVVGRPAEMSTAIPLFYPYVIDIGGGTHWVFFGDNAGAATTRRITLYTFNTTSQALTWVGFIIVTPPSGTNHTMRGLAVARHTYSTGTVSVSGATVTGTSTAWQTARYAVGGRIGFGSTSPNSITNWYIISAITNDTTITITGAGPGTLTSVSFVIEELRIYFADTAATNTNSGLFVAKGVNFFDFIPVTGTTIAAAVSTDNVKACYWLQDAATVTSLAVAGLAIAASFTDTSHIMYITNADAATTLRIYKFDGRSALTVSSGASTSAFVLKTGQKTSAGTLSQTNACCLATMSSGPGSGVSCLYVACTTQIDRILESNITSGGTSFYQDTMTEVPPGGTATFAATNGITSVAYASTIDRLIITTQNNQQNYVTAYQTSAGNFDRWWGCCINQIDQSTADSGTVACPATATTSQFSVFDLNGCTYFCRTSVNQIYVVPMGVDWDYASTTNCRLISPSMTTTGCVRFCKLYVANGQLLSNNYISVLGNTVGLPSECYRTYYRTSGISDNSGSWTLMDDTGDLTGVTAANAIQFMFEFRIIGPFMTPAKIYGFVCTYQDGSTDSHYRPSAGLSSLSGKYFVWHFVSQFGGTVPTLYVYILDGDSGSTLLGGASDNTASPAYGTFTKSTDGVTFGSYNTTDLTLGNTTTYIKYTPSSLSDNIYVRALLTQ